MTEKGILELIKKRIDHYRKTNGLLHDDFSKGALVALMALSEEIKGNK